MRDVTMKLLLLADGNAEPALRYLKAKGRAVNKCDLHVWLEELSPEEQAGLVQPAAENRLALRQLAEAQQFAREFRLVQWVQDQSTRKGLAP
jgi:hypothetical protein